MRDLKSKILSGNSGCSLTIFRDNIFKIRKQSSNKSTSNRLKEQYNKFKEFKKFKNISTPKIFECGHKNKNFFYDMEYLNGKTLSLILISRPFTETVNIIDNIFKFIFFCRDKSDYIYQEDIFFRKIKSLKKMIDVKEEYIEKIFLKAFKYDWSNISYSNSHGDLSLENVIINKNKVYFIDLSRNFINNYKLDISKLLFDLISCWSFRDIEYERHLLEINSLKKYILTILNKRLSTKDILDIKMFILIDFLRVLAYTKNPNNKNLLKKYLKNFYDNFNNPMRW